MLNYQTPAFKESKEWRVFDMTFDSLEFSQVTLRLVRAKGEKSGGPTCRSSRANSSTSFAAREPRCKSPASTAKRFTRKASIFPASAIRFLGRDPAPGVYTIWHTYPRATVLPGGRLHIGDKVLASYYVTEIIHDSQVMCSLSDPKTLELVQWQIQQMHKTHGPGRLRHGLRRAAHARLRSSGAGQNDHGPASGPECPAGHADDSARSPRQAHRRLVRPLRSFPQRQAGSQTLLSRQRPGPLVRRLQGLSKDIIILNWHGFDDGDRIASLKFFSDRGNPQILSGYYDHDPAAIKPWLSEAAHIPGVQGVMYTTWKSDYKDLQKYRDAVANWKPDTMAQP